MTFADYLKLAYWRLRVGSHLHRNDALGALHRAWAYVHATHLDGDYYEFGVYRGNSLICSWLSYRYFRRRLERGPLPYRRSEAVSRFIAAKPVFYGFDTFAGMPANDEGADYVGTGSFASSQAEVLASCAAAGLRLPDLVLAVGLFADNAAAIGPRAAAVVHIDCDLYASTRDALALIEPRIVQGTVLLCDDYDLFMASDERGERLAVREFCDKSGIRLEPWFAYGAASRAFLCHRRLTPVK